MKITKAFLESKCACREGTLFVTENNMLGLEVKDFLTKLLFFGKIDWCYWLFNKINTRKQNLKLAIFAAEQVIEFFEKKHPDDKRPRTAIDAAKAVLKRNTKANRDKARADAADAADAANYAYDAADAAAAYAADAAYAAAYAAAYYAAYAAAYAANAANAVNAAAKKEMQSRIINFGINLLK